MLSSQFNDDLMDYLSDETGALNDRLYSFLLTSTGQTGSIDDLIKIYIIQNSIIPTTTVGFFKHLISLGKIPYQELLPLFENDEQGLLIPSINDAVADGRLYQDAAGTLLADAVNDPVGRVEDYSGNGNHLTQSTATARPLLKQDANGNWYLQFNGTDDYLEIGTFALPTEHYHALAYDTNGDASGLLWNTDVSAPYMNAYADGNAGAVSSPVTFNDLWVNKDKKVITNRGDVYSEINGKNVSVFKNSTSGQSAAWRFGVYPPSSAYNISGRLYAMLWRDRMTSAERDLVTEYFASQSGVTL